MVFTATWTDYATETLLRMYGEGCSARAISVVLEVTRNTVCGKIHRLKLKAPPRMKHTPEPKAARKTQAPQMPRPHIDPAPMKMPAFEAFGTPVPLLELQWFHCRAPLDEPGADGLAMFCGATTAVGTSWCHHHRRLFFTHRSSP